MSEMSRYCKAYLASQLRRFSGWKEEADDRRPPLGDADVLYLHESYVVTDGIFKDEHVVFADGSEEWRRFCRETLGFQLPDDVSSGPSPSSLIAEPV